MADLKEKILKYASEYPIRFTALATFSTLGGIPIITFLTYSLATIVASLIGAVILELFLLVLGVAALAFVLVFVSCATVCVTGLFMAFYYSLAVANCTWKLRKRGYRHGWSSIYRQSSDHSRLSEQNDDDNEPFDKSKLQDPALEIGHLSQTFVSSLSSATDLPPKTHDFLRTALVTLFLVTVIFVMFLCVLFTACIVIRFT